MDRETVILWWRDWVSKQESDKFVLNSDFSYIAWHKRRIGKLDK